MIRSVPVGRLTALVALGVGVFFLVTHRGSRAHFRALVPGMEFATFRGEPFCRHGSAEIAVLRIDPARLRFRVHHYTNEPDRVPLDLVQWQQRTGALAVFNAGQYYPDYSYMGLLVSDGEVVSRRLHPHFKAAFVGSMVQGQPRARVLDLEIEALDPRRPAWREVAQSFMLFDRKGQLRARRSNQAANRTIVAEDGEGRILVIATEGGYTLQDFATLLRAQPQLQITHAMSMDGGQEAELCVITPGFRYVNFGRWSRNGLSPEAQSASVPLPAVISISRP